MKEKLPLSKQISYALGQFGWSMLAGIINSFIVYYFIPTADSGIPIRVPQVTFFGVLTIIGFIMMIGRFFDAVTDPLIATLSDRSKSKHGRRISFMRFSALPFAILTVLVFWSPVAGVSWMNALFLGLVLLLFYLFLTMYVTPYMALMSELGHTPDERLNLSTFISITWFLGFAVASQAAVIWNIFVDMGMDKPFAMRITFTILSVIAFILMMIPVFTIDEKRYCESKPSKLKMMDSIKATFSQREFRIFVYSDLVYWVAVTIFQSAMIYYVTVLLKLPEAMSGLLIVLLGVGSFIFYAPINMLAKRFGKKKMMVVAFILFVTAYAYSTMLGNLPFAPEVQAYILVALAAIPMAIFGIIPNVIIADIAEYDARKSGIRREAMYFGTRTFMSKVGQMISMVVLSSLLVIQRNGSNAFGVRLTALAAALFCFAGLIIFLFYDEKKVLAGLKDEVIETKEAV